MSGPADRPAEPAGDPVANAPAATPPSASPDPAGPSTEQAPGAPAPAASGSKPLIDPAWARALEEPVERFFTAFRLPLAAAFLVLAGTLWLYGILVAQEDGQLGRLMDARVSQLRSGSQLELQLRADALDQLARSWEKRSRVNLDLWSLDAEMLLRRNMQFRAVAWLGSDFATVAIHPATAQLPGWGLSPMGDEARLRTLRSMIVETSTTFSSSYVIGDGSRQVLVCAPMRDAAGGTSYMVGVMRPHDLIDVLVANVLRQGYSVAVYEGPYLIFGEDWSESGEGTRWTREAEVVGGELGLRMRLWPSDDLLEVVRTRAPRAELVAGIILALLIALLVRRTEVLSDRLEARRQT